MRTVGSRHVLSGLTIWYGFSLSRYNGVDPAQTVREHGADAARVFVLFKAPPSAVLDWDSNAIHGVERWLHRVWALVHEHADALRGGHSDVSSSSSSLSSSDQSATAPIASTMIESQGNLTDEDHGSSDDAPDSTTTAPATTAADIARAAHAAVQSVTRALDETHSFNTAVSDLMKLSNTLKPHASRTDATWAIRALVVMLAPAAPHIAAELWHEMRDLPGGGIGWQPHLPVFEQRWPDVDENALRANTVDFPVQVGVRAHSVHWDVCPVVVSCYNLLLSWP